MSITDVAREAGVSAATVSRVLNDTGYPVRPETRQRVLDAVRKLDFRPNDLARALLLKRTGTVGLIIPDIANPYYPGISRGVEDVAASRLFAVIFCNTDRDADKSERYVNALLQKRVDGIIIAGGGTDFGNAAETFASFGTEVVFIGRPPHPWASVQVDNQRAAEDATSHLAGLGHERIAFIRGPAELASAQDRLRGYRRAVRRHGLVYDERLVRIGDFGEESGYEGACALLGARPRPTAIFAANDRMAIGVLAAASDLGVRVPDELSLVGVDDIVMAAYVRPALTTVAMPAYDLGAAAMRLLAERLEAKRQAGRLDGRPPRVRLPVELVVRDSTAPPPGRRRRAGGGPSNPIPKEQAT